MIKKMTKYTFVVMNSEVETFLARLQELGVVDITRSSRPVDASSKAQFELIEHCRRRIGQLALLKDADEKAAAEAGKAADSAAKGAAKAADAAANSAADVAAKADATGANAVAELIAAAAAPSGSIKSAAAERVAKIPQEELLAAVDSLFENREKIKAEIAETKAELAAAEPWGSFSAADLEKIAAAGLVPHFYIASKKRFTPEWEKEYPLYQLGATEKNIYFVVLAQEGEKLSFPMQEVQFPQRDADAVMLSLKQLADDLARTNAELSAIAADHIPQLKAFREEAMSKVDLYLAQKGGETCAEESVAVLEGFSLVENDSSLQAALENEPVYYINEPAKVEDNPPIALKNNFFGKLYEPIGELYMFPRYNEHDLTSYFAPFYMLFFGLCMGDVGYGIVLLLLGLFVTFKMKQFASYGKLVAWLGFGTIIMPLLGGTFFGGKLYEMFPIPENIASLFFSDLKMFWFAIIFGIVQIVFARFLKVCFAISDKNYTTALGETGWMLLIIWCSLTYASMEAGFEVPAIVTYIGAYGGLGLILLFSSNTRNIFVRLFKGVSSLYDITGVFGDVLSYIRLFGLGTAGGILGLVVNSVAMQMSGIPYLGWVLTVIMLLFGHTAVLMLSALGAFVHPMRLTFVEFYKNVGFEGGGRKFRPLGK